MLATEIVFKLRDGNKIPALGLGTVPPEDPSELKQQVLTAVKAGYRHIDTAWYYGTEKYIGQALKELFDEGIVKREDLFITTKVWPSYHANPAKSLDESLSNLGIDYVDLLLQHWPLTFKGDENGLPAVPKNSDGSIAFADDPANGTGYIDFYKKLEELADTDKVKSLGVSNYAIPRLEKLLSVARHKPVVNQIEYHPQLPQQDLIDFATKNDIHISAYSPVGSSGAPVLKIPLIQELAKKYDVTTNEIANAYHILQGRSALPRSSNLERIRTNIRLPKLSKDELDQLYQVGVENPTRYVRNEWGTEIGFKWWTLD